MTILSIVFRSRSCSLDNPAFPAFSAFSAIPVWLRDGGEDATAEAEGGAAEVDGASAETLEAAAEAT